MQRMNLDDDRGGWGTVRERVLRKITNVAVKQSRGLSGSLFLVANDLGVAQNVPPEEIADVERRRSWYWFDCSFPDGGPDGMRYPQCRGARNPEWRIIHPRLEYRDTARGLSLAPPYLEGEQSDRETFLKREAITILTFCLPSARGNRKFQVDPSTQEGMVMWSRPP